MGMKHALCESVNEDSIEYYDLKKYHIQEKKDGTRCFAMIKDGHILELLNRRGINPLKKYPQLKQDQFRHTNNAIIDGEICVNTNGKSDFQALLSKENWTKAVFYAFDLLSLDNTDLTTLPYATRYAMLKDLIERNDLKHIKLVKNYPAKLFNGLWISIKETHREGLVLKESDSPYIPKRSKKWLKLKTVQQADVIFTGYDTNPKGITLTNEKGIRVSCLGEQHHAVRKEIDEKGSALCEINYLRINPSGKFFQPTFSKLKGADVCMKFAKKTSKKCERCGEWRSHNSTKICRNCISANNQEHSFKQTIFYKKYGDKL